VSSRALSRLATALAPEVVAAIVDLVEERVAAGVPAGVSASPWLSIDESADYLRVSVRTLERSIAAGRLRSATLGRRRLVHRDDLDALAVAAATREDVAPTTPPRRRARTLDRAEKA
jgi:excisionase family DNA binding protein